MLWPTEKHSPTFPTFSFFTEKTSKYLQQFSLKCSCARQWFSNLGVGGSFGERAKEMVAVLEVKRMTPVGNCGLPQRERALCGPSGTSAVTWRLSHLTEITWTSLLFSITFLLGGLHEKSPFLLCNLCQRKKLMIAPLHEEK